MISQRRLFLVMLLGALLPVVPCPAQDGPGFKVVIPAAKDVAAIRVEIYKTSAAEGYVLKLTDEKSMEPVLAWLRSIDFDPAKGADGKAAKLGHFGQIDIATKDGKSQMFGLSSKLVVVGGWIWAADTDKLLPILKKLKGK